jgi:hypothetical protein
VVRSGEYARCDGLLQEVEFELWEQRRERKLASVLQRRQPIVLGALSGFARTDRDLLARWVIIARVSVQCSRVDIIYYSRLYMVDARAITWTTSLTSCELLLPSPCTYRSAIGH